MMPRPSFPAFTEETTDALPSSSPSSSSSSWSSRVAAWLTWIRELESRGAVSSALVGGVKGACLSLVPALLLERRLSHAAFRRSAALAVFVASTRALTALAPKLPVPLPYARALIGAVSAAMGLRIDATWAQRRVLIAWLALRAARVLVPTTLSDALGTAGPTLVMMLASAQILAAWIFAPEQLDAVFVAFLNSHGGQRVSDIALFRGASPPLASPCFCVHPGLSCARHSALFLLAACARAFKLYAPLHLLLVLASPERSLSRYVRALLHSTLFLGLYCTFAWRSACFFFSHMHPGVARAPLLIPTLAAGLALVAERPSRQAELAVYVASYALDSLVSWLGASRLAFLPKSFPEILTVSSVAVLFHHKSQLPHIVSDWLLRL